MRNLGLCLWAFCTALVSTAPVGAQDSVPKKERIDVTALSDDELVAAHNAATERGETDYCGFFVPVLSQLETRGIPIDDIAVRRSRAELACATEGKRWDVVYQQIKYLERRGLTFPTLYAQSVAQIAGALTDASSRLLAHIDGMEAGTGFEAEARQLWSLLRKLQKEGRQADRLQLLRDLSDPPRLAKMGDTNRRAILSALFVAEVESGNIAAAGELAENVRNPIAMLGVLGDRRYAALWPRLEAQAGESLELMLGANVKDAKAAFEAKPDNPVLLPHLALAYLYAGRFEDVVALVEAHRPTLAKMPEIEENLAWALDAEVSALDALGRHADADAVFDQLAAIPFDPAKNGWLVNFVINRGSRLVDLGQFEKGLRAAERAAEIAEGSGSGYARMLVRRDRVCALTALGRKGEAEPILVDVDANVDDSTLAAVQAFLCAEKVDRAAAIAIAAMNDPAQAQLMITALQKPEFTFYSVSTSPGFEAVLRSRKDVDDTFRKVGRDIPVRFAPSFGKRKALQAAGKVAKD